MNNPVVQFNEAQARMLLNIVDVGCMRGAWRGQDLAAIGQIYDYVNAHLQAKKPTPVQPNVVSNVPVQVPVPAPTNPVESVEEIQALPAENDN